MVILYLLVLNFMEWPNLSYPGIIVVLALLFNLLAFQFRFRTSVTAGLRILALLWIVFCIVYVMLVHHSRGL